MIAIATNTPLDDYDTDVTTEENDDCRQPKEKKLYNAKGNFVPSKHPFYTFVSVGVTNKIDDKAVTELKESSTNDTCNSELSKYEEYLKEAMKNDISPPVNVSEKMQCLIKNNQNFSVTPIGPIGDHIISEFFHQLISPSFASSYVANCYQDAFLLRELFIANKEPQPDIIVYPHQTEMYKDLNKDKKANDMTIADLKLENPTIANLLIDHFDAHTECKYAHMHCSLAIGLH